MGGRVHVASYRELGLNKREMVERLAFAGEWLFGDWHTHVVARCLCYVYACQPVTYDKAWGCYLEAASRSGRIADPAAFKRSVGDMKRLGLVEGYNLVDEGEEWERCVEEERVRAERDKRIKRSPEERCLEKLGHDYWIQATPRLCRLLYEKIASKPCVLRAPKPPCLVAATNPQATPLEGTPLVQHASPRVSVART